MEFKHGKHLAKLLRSASLSTISIASTVNMLEAYAAIYLYHTYETKDGHKGKSHCGRGQMPKQARGDQSPHDTAF